MISLTMQNIEGDSAGFNQYVESVPLTVEWLLSRLLPHASKWFYLGKALSVDEDRLKEIYTTNERDNDSLREMLKVYMARSDLNHCWKEIEAVLKMIKSSELHSYVVT